MYSTTTNYCHWFLKVIWVLLISKKSAVEKGTLYQLKNLINRTAVPTEPDTNLKAAEDFLLVVLHAHIVAAAEVILSQQSISSVGKLAEEIVNKYLNINIPSVEELRRIAAERKQPAAQRRANNQGAKRKKQQQSSNTSNDGVCLYAREVLSIGLIWHEFHDAVKEGDGERVTRVWKFLLLVFKNSGRKNYSLEALNLFLQEQYTL